MSTIANLDINLGARTGGAEKGLAKVGQAVTKLKSTTIASSFGNFASIAKGFAVAAAGAVAAKVSFNAVSKSMEDIDTLAKSSTRLGVPIGQLQALHLAADLANAPIELLDSSMLKLNRNLATGKGGDSLNALGLSVASITAMQPAERFAAIADGFSKLTSAEQAAAIATDLFGKSGAELLPMLAEGGQGIRAAQADIAKFGKVLNDVDSARVQAANDAITRLNLSFKAVTDTIAIEFSPIIQGAVEWLTDGFSQGVSFGDAVAAGAQAAGVAVAWLGNNLSGIVGTFEILSSVNAAFFSAVTAGISKLAKFANKWITTDFGTAAEKFTGELSQTSDKLSKDLFKDGLDKVTKAITFETFRDLQGRFEKNRADAEQAGRGAGKGNKFAMLDDEEAAKKTGAKSAHAAAVERGTAAAASAILAANKAVSMENNAKAQLDTLKSMKADQTRILRAIEKGGLATADI